MAANMKVFLLVVAAVLVVVQAKPPKVRFCQICLPLNLVLT